MTIQMIAIEHFKRFSYLLHGKVLLVLRSILAAESNWLSFGCFRVSMYDLWKSVRNLVEMIFKRNLIDLWHTLLTMVCEFVFWCMRKSGLIFLLVTVSCSLRATSRHWKVSFNGLVCISVRRLTNQGSNLGHMLRGLSYCNC